MVTICTSSFTFNNSTFCPHSAFMCFVWIWEQTTIISLYNFNWLVFITETDSVYCAVRAGYWYTLQCDPNIKRPCFGLGGGQSPAPLRQDSGLTPRHSLWCLPCIVALRKVFPTVSVFPCQFDSATARYLSSTTCCCYRNKQSAEAFRPSKQQSSLEDDITLSRQLLSLRIQRGTFLEHGKLSLFYNCFIANFNEFLTARVFFLITFFLLPIQEADSLSQGVSPPCVCTAHNNNNAVYQHTTLCYSKSRIATCFDCTKHPSSGRTFHACRNKNT